MADPRLSECLEHLEASYRLLAQAHELSEPSSTEIGTGKVSIVHTGSRDSRQAAVPQ
jgi:hypothetical protein